MPTFIMQPAHWSLRVHQKNWGAAPALQLRRWLALWARRRERRELRDLAEDPHLLNDLGLTREQALEEANKPFWR
jgi:uncharacterized protein YjiS (DUF1127 family)